MSEIIIKAGQSGDIVIPAEIVQSIGIKKDENVEVRILEISREKRRIALGLKQVTDDPWPELMKKFETGKEITGEIIRILEKGIILQLEDDVEGIVPFEILIPHIRYLVPNLRQTY